MENDYSKKHIKEVHKSLVKLTEELGREPLNEEVAAEAGVDVCEVNELLQFKVEPEEEKDDFNLRFRMTIKNNELEKARHELGLKQSELAKMIGIGVASYCQIECCRQFPSNEIQTKICNKLGKNQDQLFPSWLKMFSKQWNDADRERIVPINMLSLQNADLLSLPSTGRDEEVKFGERIIARDILKKAMEELSPREKEVLKMRFFDEMDLEKTGNVLGVTRERVRQIEAKALERLRSQKRISNLEEVWT